MKKCLFLLFMTAALSVVSCQKEDYLGGYDDTPTGNFQALWQIMDTKYCFFDVKKAEFGVDWDRVYDKYATSISDGMGSNQLFEVLCMMLAELRDGHVNLYGPYDIGRNWHWKTDYPDNYSRDLVDDYLGDDFKIAASGYYYRILRDNVGYLTIQSFGNKISQSGIDAVFSYFALCNGMIIDLRSNGGGNLSTATGIASRFTDNKTLVGYSCYKTGKGHNDFSELQPKYITPTADRMRWHKPVVLLVNRGCFSAANDFASMMKEFPKVTLMGDTTGGGSGMPVSSELPNGWTVRLSSAPSFDARMKDMEHGIAPDVYLQMDEELAGQGIDSMIESAIDWISSMITN